MQVVFVADYIVVGLAWNGEIASVLVAEYIVVVVAVSAWNGEIALVLAFDAGDGEIASVLAFGVGDGEIASVLGELAECALAWAPLAAAPEEHLSPNVRHPPHSLCHENWQSVCIFHLILWWCLLKEGDDLPQSLSSYLDCFFLPLRFLRGRLRFRLIYRLLFQYVSSL